MTKRISAKHKIDRRLGENLWGRPKSPLNKREYGPGQHGQRRRGKTSDFGTQLKAKQKLKGYYANITERQFRLIYAEATRLRGDTSENLIEMQVSAVVFFHDLNRRSRDGNQMIVFLAQLVNQLFSKNIRPVLME